MAKPEDISDWARRVQEILSRHLIVDADSEIMGTGPASYELARIILAAKAEAEAERDMLQDILDARPAINAGLPETYIAWSQSIYSGEATRAYIRKHGVN